MTEATESSDHGDSARVMDALVILRQSPPPHPVSSTHRIGQYRDKVASGDVCQAAEVVRDLSPARVSRRLGLREWELYWAARAVLEAALRRRLRMTPSRARRQVDAALLASARDELRGI